MGFLDNVFKTSCASPSTARLPPTRRFRLQIKHIPCVIKQSVNRLGIYRTWPPLNFRFILVPSILLRGLLNYGICSLLKQASSDCSLLIQYDLDSYKRFSFKTQFNLRHRASYIQDRSTSTPQSTLFIYLVNKHV